MLLHVAEFLCCQGNQLLACPLHWDLIVWERALLSHSAPPTSPLVIPTGLIARGGCFASQRRGGRAHLTSVVVPPSRRKLLQLNYLFSLALSHGVLGGE